MDIVKLKPATKDYIWGGTVLKTWGKEAPTDTIAETWELSFNDDGPCIIASGEYEGRLLKDVAEESDLGFACKKFPFFPILNKLISSAGNLSIQVHPSDDYALKNEGQYGKTEMWYVISAEEGAGLYVGFNKEYAKEEVEASLKDGSIMNMLCFHHVKPGDCYFIKSGTVHAIGKGVTLIEIQQNSTLTYRLYDYGRVGKDGKPRELHIEKAMKVLNCGPYQNPTFADGLLGECEYFKVTRHLVSDECLVSAPMESFASITMLSGNGTFDGILYKKGDTFFIPCGKEGSLNPLSETEYVMTIIP